MALSIVLGKDSREIVLWVLLFVELSSGNGL